MGPSAASGQPLILQGTPVQELFLRCQVGLKAVPKGPLVVKNTTFPLVGAYFACPIAQVGLVLYSNPMAPVSGIARKRNLLSP